MDRNQQRLDDQRLVGKRGLWQRHPRRARRGAGDVQAPSPPPRHPVSLWMHLNTCPPAVAAATDLLRALCTLGSPPRLPARRPSAGRLAAPGLSVQGVRCEGLRLAPPAHAREAEEALPLPLLAAPLGRRRPWRPAGGAAQVGRRSARLERHQAAAAAAAGVRAAGRLSTAAAPLAKQTTQSSCVVPRNGSRATAGQAQPPVSWRAAGRRPAAGRPLTGEQAGGRASGQAAALVAKRSAAAVEAGWRRRQGAACAAPAGLGSASGAQFTARGVQPFPLAIPAESRARAAVGVQLAVKLGGGCQGRRGRLGVMTGDPAWHTRRPSLQGWRRLPRGRGPWRQELCRTGYHGRRRRPPPGERSACVYARNHPSCTGRRQSASPAACSACQLAQQKAASREGAVAGALRLPAALQCCSWSATAHLADKVWQATPGR